MSLISAIDAINNASDTMRELPNEIRSTLNSKVTEVDNHVQNSKSGYPALNLYLDPLFSDVNAPLPGYYNPEGHQINIGLVDWDYNSTTIEMARVTENLNSSGGLRCCSVIGHANAKFIKVAITKNPSHVGESWVQMYLGGGRKTVRSGQFTFITQATGCKNGSIRIGDSNNDWLQAGDVQRHYGKQRYTNLRGWGHLDVASVRFNDDTVEFYVYFPAIANGDIENSNTITTINW